MRKVTQRAAAVSAAVIGIALVGTGCDTAKEKAGETTTSASTATTVVSTTATAPDEGSTTTTTMTGKDGKEYTVSGPILEKYNSLDAKAKQDLGEPKAEEQKNPDGGVYQQFDGGVVVHTTKSYVVWGKIRDKWNELGGSQGKLGYPTSDETDAADGGKEQTFDHGTLSWKPGEDEATVVEH